MNRMLGNYRIEIGCGTGCSWIDQKKSAGRWQSGARKMLGVLWQDGWNALRDIMYGESHTGPMTLAEIVVKF